MIRFYNKLGLSSYLPFAPAGEPPEIERAALRSDIGARATVLQALSAFEPSCTHEYGRRSSTPALPVITASQNHAADTRRPLALAAHRIVPIPAQTNFADVVQSLEETGVAGDSELKRAVAEWLQQEEAAEHFSMRFQPLYNKPSAPGHPTSARKVSHYEALIRHPHYTPQEFIPAVEKWAPVELALLALRITAQAAARYPDAALAVNMPGTAFNDKRLPSLVAKAIAEAGVETRRILIEVTETGPLPNVHRMRSTLYALREAGHQIAIDDYDLGHTRLYISALRDGPLHSPLCDLVKIDREYVELMNLSKYPMLQRELKIIDDPWAPLTISQWRDVQEVQRDAFNAFVTFVDDMHRMGLRVAAEGVKHRIEAALLDCANVDIQQGFGHSKPRPTPSIA
ncbi:EAL domain-containing protein [Trinickia sp. LjRoot230]|uniref:EAL domain-containing protein n=1 Tax=Trinickia sp. LjRoot230 TaxID=3342288 RepID=UPI003ECC54B3